MDWGKGVLGWSGRLGLTVSGWGLVLLTVALDGAGGTGARGWPSTEKSPASEDSRKRLCPPPPPCLWSEACPGPFGTQLSSPLLEGCGTPAPSSSMSCSQGPCPGQRESGRTLKACPLRLGHTSSMCVCVCVCWRGGGTTPWDSFVVLC